MMQIGLFQIIVTIGLVVSFYPTCAQSQDSLILRLTQRGAAHFEAGQIDSAIHYYDRALNIDPKRSFVNYEKAYVLYESGRIQQALPYAKTASKVHSEDGLHGIMLLATIYDGLGEHNKAIKRLTKSTKRYGDYYLLWYNAGVSALRAEKFLDAETYFLNAIASKPDHADSHLAIARMMIAAKRKSEALYALSFFLMLEPTGSRAASAYNSIAWLFGLVAGHQKGELSEIDKPKNRDPQWLKGDFLIEVNKSALTLKNQYDGGSDHQALSESIQSVFLQMMDWQPEKTDGFFQNDLVPLFATIAASEHMEAFSHYIAQSSNDDSRQWVRVHYDAIEAFFTWLDTLDSVN